MKLPAAQTARDKIRSNLGANGPSRLMPIVIFLGAMSIAAMSSFVIYPEVAGPLSNKVTTDRYDELAWGIVHNGTLSFFPDPRPTVLRGPVYPFFLAAVFALGEHLLPFSAQLAQALFHGLTCLLAYAIGKNLVGNRRALLAAALCAIHPYLLWYTGRMVIETVSIFIFTLIVYCVIELIAKPSHARALGAGLAIGAGVLCKSTYLPFVPIIPFLLLVLRPRLVRSVHAATLLAVSIAVMAPWVIRNHEVSGTWGIVQALTGYNFYVGDAFVDRYGASPLSYRDIIERTDFTKMDEGLPAEITRAEGARREVLHDAWLLSRSLERYAQDPLFLMRKVAANAVMFWTLGSTPPVSIVTMALQLPLLFFFSRSTIRQMKRHGPFCPASLPFWLIAVYFAVHLPVYALARFSVVFIPTMIAASFLPDPSSD